MKHKPVATDTGKNYRCQPSFKMSPCLPQLKCPLFLFGSADSCLFFSAVRFLEKRGQKGTLSSRYNTGKNYRLTAARLTLYVRNAIARSLPPPQAFSRGHSFF